MKLKQNKPIRFKILKIFLGFIVSYYIFSNWDAIEKYIANLF